MGVPRIGLVNFECAYKAVGPIGLHERLALDEKSSVSTIKNFRAKIFKMILIF